MQQVDKDALEAFTKNAVPVLRNIHAFVQSGNGAPAPGSPLSADDELWSHHPLSQVAWLAMISASDHLDLICKVVEIAEEHSFITAPFSLARGALVAASQALWILADQSPVTRQQRGLSIAIESAQQRLGYQNEQLKVCSPEQRALSQRQIDDLLKPMLVEALNLSKKGFGYTDTKVIAEAARYRFAGAKNMDAILVTADLHWRRLGGDAHALGWQLMLSGPSWEPGHAADALAPATVPADFEALIQASMWAATVLRVAMERFQELSKPATS